MRPILTLTLNPALDIATTVPVVRPDEKLRCGDPSYNSGGGGLNVSRALHRLGVASLALVALGGLTGDQLANLLRAEGIDFLALKSPGETRQSMNVTERQSGAQYRFLLPGPVWDDADQARVINLLTATARPGGIAVISGSQPPGVPANFPGSLAAAMPETQIVLDTSGAALAEAVACPISGLAVLRMDSDEAEALACQTLPNTAATAEFARSLIARGVAQVVIVARGAEGNVLVTSAEHLIARPPHVAVKSAVGAGDSFVAGLVMAMARRDDWSAALALGTACAAAAVMTEATELCRMEDVERLLTDVRVAPVRP